MEDNMPQPLNPLQLYIRRSINILMFCGLLSDHFGGKWLASFGGLLQSFSSILVPSAFYFLGTNGFFGIRIFNGFARGLLVVSTYSMLAKWFPRSEQLFWTTFVLSGTMLGGAVSYAFSVPILHRFHWWPAPMYMFGGLLGLWSLLFPLSSSSSPGSHPWIGDEEALDLKKYYLESNILQTSPRVPLLSILGSRHVWAYFLVTLGNHWAVNTLTLRVPDYISKALHTHLHESGHHMACGYLIMWVFALLCAKLGETLIEQEAISPNNCRRLFATISTVGPSVCLVLVVESRCQKVWTVGWMINGMCWAGAALPGFGINPLDLAPNHAATIAGFVNGLCAIAIALYNMWALIKLEYFLVTAGFVCLTNLIYAFLLSSNLQPWNSPSNRATRRSSQPFSL